MGNTVHRKKVHLENPIVTVDQAITSRLDFFLYKICKADGSQQAREDKNRDFMKDNWGVTLVPLIGEDMKLKSFVSCQSLTEFGNKGLGSSYQTIIRGHYRYFHVRQK